MEQWQITSVKRSRQKTMSWRGKFRGWRLNLTKSKTEDTKIKQQQLTIAFFTKADGYRGIPKMQWCLGEGGGSGGHVFSSFKTFILFSD